jgi:hypothetical protein
MSDRSGNAGDQPAPGGPPYGEPVAPGYGEPVAPGYQSPAWPPAPPAPAWPPAPPAPYQAQPLTAPDEAVPPTADQPAAEVPAGDAGQGWPLQPAPYGSMFGPPPQTGGGGFKLLWPIMSILLLLALLGTAAFAFVTYSDLNKTKDSLAAEQTARQAADAKVAALKTCVASMKTDEAALTAAIDQLTSLTSRAAPGGDIDAARKAYESALRTAEQDYKDAGLGWNHATNQAQWDAAIALYLQAQSEQATAATLLTTLDSLVSEYGTAVSEAASAAQAATAQLAKTATQCNAAAS